MRNIGIHEPCSENWNTMTPTEKGAFCQKCATQVYDFTHKSNHEIKQTLRSLIGQPVCGRITATQEATLNAEFEAYTFRSTRSFQSAFAFSLLVVFGLALFSCSDEKDKKQIERVRTSAVKAMKQQPEEIIQTEITEKSTPAAIEAELIEVESYITRCSVEEPVAVREDYDLIRSYAGGMRWSDDYEVYLMEETIPVAEELDQNGQPFPKVFASIVFPNPVSTETTFEMSLPLKSNFEISLYDMNGKLIRAIHSGEIERGTYREQLDMTDLNPGIYLVTIYSEAYKETVRISKI